MDDLKLVFPFSYNNDFSKIRKIDTYTEFGFIESDKDYIDLCLGNCGCFMLGFKRTDIINDVSQKMKNTPFISGEYLTTNPDIIQLTEKLYQLSGGYRSLFSLSGSDAIEGAIKLSKLYHYSKGSNKKKIIGLQNSYHGSTYLTSSIGNLHYMTNYYGTHTDCVHIPIDITEEEILDKVKILASESLCLIIESCSWNNFLHQYSKSFWNQLRQICKDNDVNFIIDDIAMCGGKTGTFFGFDLDLEPDIFCVGKAFSGGYYPLSACLIHSNIYDNIKNEFLAHGFTYSFSLSGIYSTIKYIDLLENGYLNNYEIILEKTKKLFFKLKSNGIIYDFRNYGLMFNLEIKQTREHEFYQNGLNVGIINDKENKLIIIIPLDANDNYFKQLEERLISSLLSV